MYIFILEGVGRRGALKKARRRRKGPRRDRKRDLRRERKRGLRRDRRREKREVLRVPRVRSRRGRTETARCCTSRSSLF